VRAPGGGCVLCRGGDARSSAFGRQRDRDHGGAGAGPSDGPERLSLPDTCPDRGSGWSLRSSSRYGRRSVKPSADATLVRTRHLPLLLAQGKSPRSRPSRRQQRRGSKPCGRCSAGASLPISGCLAPSRSGNAALRARPVPTRQNSRFWMSATSRTVIVRGVPNGGCAWPGSRD
jgi:hypothetical protein